MSMLHYQLHKLIIYPGTSCQVLIHIPFPEIVGILAHEIHISSPVNKTEYTTGKVICILT